MLISLPAWRQQTRQCHWELEVINDFCVIKILVRALHFSSIIELSPYRTINYKDVTPVSCCSSGKLISSNSATSCVVASI